MYFFKDIGSLLTCLLIVTSFFYGTAQSSLQEQLESLFDQRYGETQAGASILVSKNGEVLLEKQYGNANIELDIPVSESTKFHIGSLTKQFTAAAIMMLVEEGKLSTEDYIGRYLYDFSEEEYPIKIRHLLTHTSGLPSDNTDKDISKKMRYHLSTKNIYETLMGEPLRSVPGTEYSYSNNGYIFLGLIIEKVSGLTFSEFLEQRIFKPLALQNTCVGYFQDIIKNRASGYDTDLEDRTINATYHSSSFGAGAIISTAADLAIWTEALFKGRIISLSSLKAMLTNRYLEDGTLQNLGCGWEINTIKDQQSFEHSGYEPGFKCYSIYMWGEGIHVVVLQNTEIGTPSTVAIHAAAIVSGSPYPNDKNSVSLASESMRDFCGQYLFDGDRKRIIGLSEGVLYLQSPGGLKRQLNVLNTKVLYLNNGYSQFHFQDNGSEGFQNVKYVNRISVSNGKKLTYEVPVERKYITLSTEVLSKYVGHYKADDFEFEIKLIKDNIWIWIDATGETLELLPMSSNEFYLNEIGAEFKFIDKVTEHKPVILVELLTEGRMMKGQKVN